MLCSHVFQPSFSRMMGFHWPVCSLWPEIRPLFFQEEMLQRHMQEMKNNLDFVDKLQQRIFEDVGQVPSSMTVQPVSYKLEKDGDHFALTLDTKDFFPEQLSVKQVGRKLRVCGKMEKQEEDGKSSYSYKRQEFRQEFDLPEGVNPNAVTCSLSDGQLKIQAPKEALPEEAERMVPIDCSPVEKTLHLWPEIRPLFFQEEMLQRHMLEMKNNLDFVDKLQQRIFEDIEQVSSSMTVQPVSYKLEKDGDHFALTLDTEDFSPEQLSVKQVGRKLRVCGKMEKQEEDGKSSYSYKRQEFRQEFDLPEGVNPNAVTCSLSDGRLKIQAPKETLPEETERMVPIDCSPVEKTLHVVAVSQKSLAGSQSSEFLAQLHDWSDVISLLAADTQWRAVEMTGKFLNSLEVTPSFSRMMGFHWPVCSLWPEIRPLFFQEEMLQRHMQEMKNNLDFVNKLQQRIFEDTEQVPSSLTIQPVSYKLEKDGDHFALTLDTKDFSPEQLSVKQVGRKLRVCGKMEKQEEDGKSSYSYKRQEFRQEFDLPEGVNPNAVTCSLSDGQLKIQAPKEALPEEAERMVPIDCIPVEKTL
ncbi:hypothetical protein JZ751_005781, partial [Albula glossodonta]